MYFDSHPKTKKQDLYDRESELEQFMKALSYTPIIVVTGLRRTGKTSFVNVALSESGFPYAFLDLRELPYNPSRSDVVRRLEGSFRQIDRRWFSDVVGAIRHLRGVSVLGNEVSFEWGKAGIDLGELFAEINKWATNKKVKFVVAFDEIQVIRGDRWMLRFLAHAADTYSSVPLVVTGSEVGVLFDFLGFDKPDSPLFGRHFVQVQMKDFSPTMAKDFLCKGFKQIKLRPSMELLDYTIQRLDGIPGWLTMFGVRCRDMNAYSKEIVDEVATEAGKLARAEVLKIAALSRRYAIILNFLAKVGEASWSQARSVIEAKEKKSASSHVVSTALKNLVNTGILVVNDGKYGIADSVLAYAIKEGPLPE